jgi:hypothetical protein
MGKAAELGRKYLRGYEKKARPPRLTLLSARQHDYRLKKGE